MILDFWQQTVRGRLKIPLIHSWRCDKKIASPKCRRVKRRVGSLYITWLPRNRVNIQMESEQAPLMFCIPMSTRRDDR